MNKRKRPIRQRGNFIKPQQTSVFFHRVMEEYLYSNFVTKKFSKSAGSFFNKDGIRSLHADILIAALNYWENPLDVKSNFSRSNFYFHKWAILKLSFIISYEGVNCEIGSRRKYWFLTWKIVWKNNINILPNELNNYQSLNEIKSF